VIRVDEKTIEQIVDLVIQEIHKRSKSATGSSGIQENLEIRKEVLLVFNGSTSGLEDILGLLKRYIPDLSYNVVLTETASRLFGENWISDRIECNILKVDEAYEVIPKTDLVVFPNLTQNTAAKAVRGIRDSVGSDLIAFSLIKGRKVLALSDAVQTDSMPAAYSAFCRDILSRLSRIGVKVIRSGGFSGEIENFIRESKDDNRVNSLKTGVSDPVTTVSGSAVSRSVSKDPGSEELDLSSKKILSARMLQEAISEGAGKILISPEAIVTPLAMDMAKDRKISLIRT